ncbi:MAG: BamA/TamA family outer membrane protein [Ignavibacteriales bacterium]|nr:BamA/TamA family outer membrane protein [Ignavibacteriales bacterium]
MKFKLSYIFIFLFAAGLFAQPNKKFELTQINFENNSNFSSSVLREIIFSKESPNWLSQLLNKISSLGGKAVYFDSLLIQSDINALKNFYHANGFFKVKINSNYQLDSSNNEARLSYTIFESQPVYFNSLTLKGLEWIAPEFQELLTDYCKVDTNKIYEDAIVDEKKNYTSSFLRDHGFMLISADRPTVVIDTMKNKVDVELKFMPGNRYKISDLYTQRTGKGVDLVDDALLKDIVGIKIGSWYSNYDIQRGQVRLFRTNLFTSAAVMGVISDTVGNNVPLNISADIGLMHELSPEIIMNNEDNTFNLGLALNFIKKNFLGDARKFTIGTSAAAQNISEFLRNPSFADSAFYGYFDARVSIEQPFLFGDPITTKLETYFTTQKRKNEYNSIIIGGRLSFDFELPQFIYFNSFNVYLNVERSEYDYKPAYIKNLLSQSFQIKYGAPKNFADSVASNYVDKDLGGRYISQSTNAAIGINLGANKTNDTFFPSNGYALSFLLEDGNSIPYLISRLFKSGFTRPLFFKGVITSSVYLPVYNSKVDALGIKFKIGQIFTYRGEQSAIPLNQRLYAGGSNSVRGWGTRQLVPKKVEFDLAANPTQDDLEAFLGKGAATGGFFLMEGSVETRNRLIGRLGTALFIDYGNTWNGYQEFRYDEIAVAAGFGLRYYSDFVPLRIDFGFKIYDPNDRRPMVSKEFWKEILQFHIGIGEAF